MESPGQAATRHRRLNSPGPLARSANANQVIPACVEYPHLRRAPVRHGNPPVGQPCRVDHPVQHVRFFAFENPDRHRRLRSDPPWKPRSLGRLRVLHDPDTGAVALETGQSGRGLPVLTASDRKGRPPALPRCEPSCCPSLYSAIRPLQRPYPHILHPEFVPEPPQEVILADLVNLEPPPVSPRTPAPALRDRKPSRANPAAPLPETRIPQPTDGPRRRPSPKRKQGNVRRPGPLGNAGAAPTGRSRSGSRSIPRDRGARESPQRRHRGSALVTARGSWLRRTILASVPSLANAFSS